MKIQFRVITWPLNVFWRTPPPSPSARLGNSSYSRIIKIRKYIHYTVKFPSPGQPTSHPPPDRESHLLLLAAERFRQHNHQKVSNMLWRFPSELRLMTKKLVSLSLGIGTRRNFIQLRDEGGNKIQFRDIGGWKGRAFSCPWKTKDNLISVPPTVTKLCHALNRTVEWSSVTRLSPPFNYQQFTIFTFL